MTGFLECFRLSRACVRFAYDDVCEWIVRRKPDGKLLTRREWLDCADLQTEIGDERNDYFL